LEIYQNEYKLNHVTVVRYTHHLDCSY